MILEWLVRQHLFTAKLGWYQLRVDLVSVFPGNVSSHSVVPGEAAMTIGAGHSDSLMSLSYVGSQVGLVSIGSLAKWAFEFSSYKNDN